MLATILATIPDLPAHSTSFRDIALAGLLLVLIVLAGLRSSRRSTNG